MGTSFESTSFPEIVELPRLLDDMARGYLLLPRAWDRWAWSDTQRLDLLRSVRDGLPIGAPLVWRTRARMPAHLHLAGRGIEPAPDGALVQYVLDGMHRLVVLWAAFAPPMVRAEPTMKALFGPPVVGGPGGPDLLDGHGWRAWLDLRTGDFRLGEGEGELPWLMPLWLSFDGRGLRRFQRELERTLHREPEIEAMLRRADDFSASAGRFRLPLQVMAVDDSEGVIRAMERSGAAAERGAQAVGDDIERAVRRLRRGDRPRPAPRVVPTPRWSPRSERSEGREAGPMDEVVALRRAVDDLADRYGDMSRSGQMYHRRKLADRVDALSTRSTARRELGWRLYLIGRLEEIGGARRAAALRYREAIAAWPREAEFHDALARVEVSPTRHRDDDES